MISNLLGSAIVIPCLTAMTAAYGRPDQKGAVFGNLRSLEELARAFCPLLSSFGKLKIKKYSHNCKQQSGIITFFFSICCVRSRDILLHWSCWSNNSVRFTASVAVANVNYDQL
jgi:hypothetical protein